MKPFCMLSFLLLLLFSCKSDSQKAEEPLLGTWQFEDHVWSIKNTEEPLPPPPPFGQSSKGFTFRENGVYDDEMGFYRWGFNAKSEDGADKYFGKTSKYKITGDSLSVYNPAYKSWETYGYKKLHKDTLALYSSKYGFEKYSRVNTVLDPNEKYERIIVSTSYCYGSCPVYNVAVDHDGKVTFFGEAFTLKKGLYTAEITKQQYADIENSFKKSGIANLQSEYFSMASDMATTTVTFIKDGKIYKTILDYGNSAPASFQWACNATDALYINLPLAPLNTVLKEEFVFTNSFHGNDTIYPIKKSEAFYLYTELLKAKESNAVFKPLYSIQCRTKDSEGSIQTDGRYYKFPPEDGGLTLDLGYNFITRNGLDKRSEKNGD